jgi:hypothetical protein
MSWKDRTVGIVLGVILGIGIVAVFVFEFSEEAVDAPSLSGGEAPGGGGGGGGGGGAPGVGVVRVVGGLPPESGPAQLTYEKGEQARLRVISDGAVTLVLQGYGITKSVPAGEPTLIEFEASKVGNFPLLSGTIGVAQIRVTPGL